MKKEELNALNYNEMREVCGGRRPDEDRERAKERRNREARERTYKCWSQGKEADYTVVRKGSVVQKITYRGCRERERGN